MPVGKSKTTQSSAKTEIKKVVEPTTMITESVEPVVEVKATPVVEVKAPVKKIRPQVDLNMMVEVRNITNGSLTYVSRKSGNEAHWSQFGDVEYMEVGELQTMKTSQPRFFNEPWVMIDDDEVVDFLGLRHMYDRIIADHEIERFFFQPIDDIVSKLQKAPHGTRELIASKAREKVENETLYDSRVIRVLEKELTIDLSMVRK